MPNKQIVNPGGAFGQPLMAASGVNDQILVEVINNCGGPIWQGVTLVWDDSTAIPTGANNPVTITAQFTASVNTQTVTAGASTANYNASGLISIPNCTYAAAGSTCPTAIANLGSGPIPFYYGALSGSTYTAAFALYASATNGVATTGTTAPTVNNWYGGGTIGTVNSTGGVFATFPGMDATSTRETGTGRLVTLSTSTSLASLASLDKRVAGVCSPSGDAGTNSSVVQPMAPFLMCISGGARVHVGGATVAALGILGTSATFVGAADDIPGTLGNVLGIALEAQSAKDTNNTIRAKIALG